MKQTCALHTVTIFAHAVLISGKGVGGALDVVSSASILAVAGRLLGQLLGLMRAAGWRHFVRQRTCHGQIGRSVLRLQEEVEGIVCNSTAVADRLLWSLT